MKHKLSAHDNQFQHFNILLEENKQLQKEIEILKRP